ncbi:hypothetical protein HU200_022402 [Digitaria exilis]|uniref:Uncharacterized protein n=1 Tax=Digitaria exilis TaxID=1010633 RepID=A0A835CDV2_9POAL|nr:hypothetical protein HU200_022402 [Digitaria exilis]
MIERLKQLLTSFCNLLIPLPSIRSSWEQQ